MNIFDWANESRRMADHGAGRSGEMTGMAGRTTERRHGPDRWILAACECGPRYVGHDWPLNHRGFRCFRCNSEFSEVAQ